MKVVTLSDGSVVNCHAEPLAAGSEGEVFATEDGRSVVKLYFKPSTDREQTLKDIVGAFNITRDNPVAERLFCWPDAIVSQPSLGLRMPKAPGDSRPLIDFLLRRARSRIPLGDRGTWQGMFAIARKLAYAVDRMHMRGLCHSDLSWSNVLVNPVRGSVTLIDCDGLVVPSRVPPQVLGTPLFMAPEVVADGATPSVRTDLHSLAVLIYMMLLGRHPLSGPKRHHVEPEEDDRLAFGKEALYIEHPTDLSNRPRNLEITSCCLGPKLEELFRRAFVTGLHSPSNRPTAGEWERALSRTFDRIVPCANRSCEQSFYVVAKDVSLRCPWCGFRRPPVRSLPILHLMAPAGGKGKYRSDDGYLVVGWPDKKLYVHHVHPNHPMDAQAVAQLRYDHQTGSWSLLNLAAMGLASLSPDGSRSPVSVGESLELKNGSNVLLGQPGTARLARIDLLTIS